MPLKRRSSDNEQITLIPNEVISSGLGARQLSVYVVLSAHADERTQQCSLPIKTMSLMSGFSVSTVTRAIRQLEQMKLIHVRRRAKQGRPSVYTMLDYSHLVPIPMPDLGDGY
jgi:DNA-binding MarR family transcriptional regulator